MAGFSRAQPIIQVDGVWQLARDFRRAGANLNPELGKEHRRIGEKVIGRAKPRAPRGPEPFHVADTMRASANARQAIVRMGGARRGPYAPIIHWGSGYRPHNQANPFIAETVRDMRDELERDYLDAVDRAVRRISAD